MKTQKNQLIQQIVKVILPSDAVQLQAGRKKKAVKRKKGMKKAKGAPGAPPGGPKGPSGVLSHIIRPQPPSYPSVFGMNVPRPFIQPPFMTPFMSPFEKSLLEKLTKKEQPEPIKKEQPEPFRIKKEIPSISMPSPIAPVLKPSISLQEARSRSVSEQIQRTREVIARSRSRRTEIMAEEVPSPPPINPLMDFFPPYSSSSSSSFGGLPTLAGAPNQANQPSVDVDGPVNNFQQSFTLNRGPPPLGPYIYQPQGVWQPKDDEPEIEIEDEEAKDEELPYVPYQREKERDRYEREAREREERETREREDFE